MNFKEKNIDYVASEGFLVEASDDGYYRFSKDFDSYQIIFIFDEMTLKGNHPTIFQRKFNYAVGVKHKEAKDNGIVPPPETIS